MRRERAPLAIGILAAAGAAFFILPLIGLVVRTPWADAARAVTSADTLEALRLSLVASLTATGVALVLGVPLAWVYARIEFPGRSVLRALTTLPMVLPPVVGGIALLLAFGRRGLLGSWLESSFGISLPFTTAGVVFAETFVAMPFLVLTVERFCGPPFHGQALRGRGADAGGKTLDDLHARHPAAHRPLPLRRCCPLLGASPR